MATAVEVETKAAVPPNNLPVQTRVITRHTPDGKSVFDTIFPAEIPVQSIDETAKASLAYVSDFPASYDNDQDLDDYGTLLNQPPGISSSRGTVLRTFDMAPGLDSALHRTVSLDYVVVLYGSLQLTLDSGESRVLSAGDIIVQRGTLHSWKNVGEGWARILAVVVSAKEVKVGGKVVGEDLGGITGLRESD